MRRSWATALLALLIAAPSLGQPHQLIGGDVQERANAVLSLMAFSVVPDLTASFLSINSDATNNPEVTMTQFGGGLTLSTSFPLYVEGTLGYNRYDPEFIATRGTEQRKVPAKWNTLAATGGIGWDFPLPFVEDLVFRPIFNFSLGHVESDSSLAGRLINFATDHDLQFLHDGRLNAYGLGGSVMLDYQRYREHYEIDVELRYTNIYLQSFDSSNAVSGTSDAETVSLWTRWRQPTGIIVAQRPLRYVLELANTTYLGDQAGVLGFNYLSSVGAGFEFDVSAIHLVLSRIRIMGRYAFGQDVSGAAFSIAVS